MRYRHLQANPLIISDIHLGRDVLEGHGAGLVRHVAQLDHDLSGFLEHYSRNLLNGRPWRLIVAGDMIEFIGMAVRADGQFATPPTAEERVHGLGSAPDHALVKLARVFDRHGTVMERLASFVRAGHSLVILRGNHDVDLFWDEVQTDLRERLVRLAGVEGSDADAFRIRVTFVPWFYYEPGLVYVEHGHQYDGLCSFDFQLYPVHPDDPRRLVDDVSTMALRYLVNPTPRLPRECGERWSVLDYLRWVRTIGLAELARFTRRYFQMSTRLVRLWWAARGARIRALREEHLRRMRALPLSGVVGEATLKAIDALKSAPLTRSLVRTMQAVFLDRFALGLAVVVATLIAIAVGAPAWAVGAVGGAALVVAIAVLYASAKQRTLDATASLRRAAAKLAQRVKARFIVMGHTHHPMRVALDEDRWYFNVGNWTHEEWSAGLPPIRAPLSHLVIDALPGSASAELRSWSSTDSIPRPFRD
jgi:UDP-2,3-diacylglucosamine pyrophosphatase LpxH